MQQRLVQPFVGALAGIMAFAALAGAVSAQPTPPPAEIATLPFLEIFSPTFFWNDTADFVRVASSTCPKGRAIAGGVKIEKGQASMRVLESYPDGESWVMRVVNRQRPQTVQSLQVRGFALCMLPAARRASVITSQYTRLQHLSHRFALPTGYVSTSGRQACPQGSLPISGGFGVDPDYHGPALLRLELSYPDPNGWNVRAVNGAPGSGPPAQVRAHTVCLGSREGANIRDYRHVRFVSTDVTVPHGEGTVRRSVRCQGDNEYVLAGGARTVRGRSAMVEMQESFPDSPASWTLALTNRGSRRDGNATVRLYAVCIAP